MVVGFPGGGGGGGGIVTTEIVSYRDGSNMKIA